MLLKPEVLVYSRENVASVLVLTLLYGDTVAASLVMAPGMAVARRRLKRSWWRRSGW